MRIFNIIFGEHIGQEKVDGLVLSLGGYVADRDFPQTDVIENRTGAIYIWYYGEPPDFNEGEEKLATERLGAAPVDHMAVRISYAQGSDEVARKFIESVLQRWRGVLEVSGDPVLRKIYPDLCL